MGDTEHPGWAAIAALDEAAGASGIRLLSVEVEPAAYDAMERDAKWRSPPGGVRGPSSMKLMWVGPRGGVDIERGRAHCKECGAVR